MSEKKSISSASSHVSPASVQETNALQEVLKENTVLRFQPSAIVQFKLTVGAPDDSLEQEADKIADGIMWIPELNFIRHKCSHYGEEMHI